MTKGQKKTLDALNDMCNQIARIRRCSVGAGEFTYEEIDSFLGERIAKAADKYADMTSRDMVVELILEGLSSALEEDAS